VQLRWSRLVLKCSLVGQENECRDQNRVSEGQETLPRVNLDTMNRRHSCDPSRLVDVPVSDFVLG
jgi:hypothetical protein